MLLLAGVWFYDFVVVIVDCLTKLPGALILNVKQVVVKMNDKYGFFVFVQGFSIKIHFQNFQIINRLCLKVYVS